MAIGGVRIRSAAWLAGILMGSLTTALWVTDSPAVSAHAGGVVNDSLLIHRPDTGEWVEAAYDPVGGTVRLHAGFWERGRTVVPLRVDADDTTDVLLYDPATGACAWAVNRNGTYAFVAGQLPETSTLLTADFNGDGLDDLLTYDPADGRWFAYVNSHGAFVPQHGGQWWPHATVVVADFTGDGRSDALVYDPVTGTFELSSPNVGQVGFTVQQGTWRDGWMLTVANLDGDARVDLFLYRPASGDWSIARSTGHGAPFRHSSGRWSIGWHVHAADVDGDGIDDVLLYDPNSGRWFQCITANGGSGFGRYYSGRWEPDLELSILDFDRDGRDDVFRSSRAIDRFVLSLSDGPGRFREVSGHWPSGWSVSRPAAGVQSPHLADPAGTDTVEHPAVLLLSTPSLLAFGDSITTGTTSLRLQQSAWLTRAWRTQVTGYPERMGPLLTSRYPTQQLTGRNAGLPGEATFQGVARLPQELDAQPWSLVLILEGINDLINQLPAADAAERLRDMVRIATARGVQVVLSTLTPVTAGNSKGVSQEAVADLNSRIRTIAVEESVVLADVHAAFGADPSLLSPDGVHPTEAGYQRMAEFYAATVARHFEFLSNAP